MENCTPASACAAAWLPVDDLTYEKAVPEEKVFRLGKLLSKTEKAYLLVTPGMVTTLKAEEIELNLIKKLEPPSGETAASSLPSPTPAANSLVLPVNILEKNNTELIRRLLLTHGIEIDLAPGKPLSVSELTNMVRDATKKK